MAVVVIRIRIGKFVVVAVQAHPVDRAVLAAEGTAGGEEPLQLAGHLESAVTEQSVIADGHPQAGGDPVENQQAGHGGQAPEARQQRNGGQHMDGDHEQQHRPVVLLSLIHI